MNNFTKGLFCCALIFFVLFSAGYGYAQTTIIPTRIAGEDRYLTAVETSQAGWAEADTVILARGDDYADALAGVPLSYMLDAPVLLTPPSYLHADTLQEIRRLKASTVLILGGANAISGNTEQELKSAYLSVERIGGVDRFETAALIANRVTGGYTDTAVIVYAYDYKDALISSPFAARMGYPILLTNSSNLSPATKGFLHSFGVKNTIVIGDRDLINDYVLYELPNPIRVANPKHENNAIAVANHFGYAGDQIFVATSRDFADAITGAALAAKENSAIFLVRNRVSDELNAFIQQNIDTIWILGGTHAVSYDIEYELGQERWIPVTGVSLHPDALSMNSGQSTQLNATVYPYNATDKSLIWASSNEEVATVDAFGTITAKGEGTAYITVSTFDSRKSASCAITVSPASVTEITITPVFLNLHINQTARLRTQITPASPVHTVTWESSASSIVSVDANGMVTGHTVGTAIICGKIDGKSATCNITIHNLSNTFATEVYLSNLTRVQNNKEVKSEHLLFSGSNSDKARLVSLANEITKGPSDDYTKVRAIAKWVATNIYYDYDNLSENKYIPSAIGVLDSRKSVCSGYSILTEALLRSLGIPARRVAGLATHKDWNEVDIGAYRLGKSTDVGPHEWNEAYVGGRWIIIDTAWNSLNKFIDGEFISGPPRENYFNPDLRTFSEDHWFGTIY